MFYRYDDASVRFSGRWHPEEEFAATVNSGATFQLAFEGEMVTLNFDTRENVPPFPHLWMSLDGGAWFEVPVDVYLHVMAEKAGTHVLTVTVKSLNENQERWNSPRHAMTCFRGYEAEKSGVLPPREKKKIIEFVGDSITEGILVDTYPGLFQEKVERVNHDDVFADYCWLTAKALGAEPYVCAFGAVGMVGAGSGHVPKAPESYPYCFADAPFTCDPDYIICNHGANDAWASSGAYLENYRAFLDLARKMHPRAQIILLPPFNGTHAADVRALADSYSREHSCKIDLIETEGWVPKEPLHPLRAGHKIIAAHLTEELKKRYAF